MFFTFWSFNPSYTSIYLEKTLQPFFKGCFAFNEFCVLVSEYVYIFPLFMKGLFLGYWTYSSLFFQYLTNMCHFLLASMVPDEKFLIILIGVSL